jgi:hypothetical protein
MGNKTPHDRKGSAAPSVERSTVEARQGRKGRRVLIILAVSLALLGIAYAAIYFLTPRIAHAAALERPIRAATRPVVAPSVPPASMSLSQW